MRERGGRPAPCADIDVDALGARVNEFKRGFRGSLGSDGRISAGVGAPVPLDGPLGADGPSRALLDELERCLAGAPSVATGGLRPVFPDPGRARGDREVDRTRAEAACRGAGERCC